MKSVRFSARPSRRRFAVLIGLFLAAFHGSLVYFWVAYMPDISSSLDDRAALPMVLVILRPVSMVLGIAGSVLIVVVGYRLSGPDNNYLLLDQYGLSYTRRGKSRYWPWSVLPGFKTVFRYRQIKFVLPEGESEPNWLGGWVHEVTPGDRWRRRAGDLTIHCGGPRQRPGAPVPRPALHPGSNPLPESGGIFEPAERYRLDWKFTNPLQANTYIRL